VQVEIDAEMHTGVVIVPASALVHESDETAVFVVVGDKAQRRAVMTGLTSRDRVEIVSGLRDGEVVIVEGQNGLPDGASVTTTEAGAAGTPQDDAAAPSGRP
jgi:multidrug efflux pump subunit AcrA (membrane-fusion protein)